MFATHLNEFNTLISELWSIGVTIDDEIRSLIMLSSLPDSWDSSLVMAVSNSILGGASLKFDDVVGVLLSKEMRRRSSRETSTSTMPMETKGGRRKERSKNQKCDKSEKRSKSRTKTVECWNCGKKGHMRKDCRLKKKESETIEGSKTSEANTAKEGCTHTVL